MDRLTLTTENEAEIAAWKAEHASELDAEVSAGSNLIADDHLQINNDWKVVVIGGQSEAVWSFMPEWPGVPPMLIDLVDFVTDRIGPNGEGLPIFDETELQARALKAGGENPSDAAEPEHERRRKLDQVLREAIKRLPHDEQKHAREVLKQKGVLKLDDKGV